MLLLHVLMPSDPSMQYFACICVSLFLKKLIPVSSVLALCARRDVENWHRRYLLNCSAEAHQSALEWCSHVQSYWHHCSFTAVRAGLHIRLLYPGTISSSGSSSRGSSRNSPPHN
jgi:hypothetical protein